MLCRRGKMAEEGSTQIDPLTSATRTTKRNLLTASVVAITFKAFDISADKIPVAGVTITFNRGVFEFLLVMVLLYFLATFILYYYIDIKNFPRLVHQEETEEWRIQATNRVASSINQTAQAILSSEDEELFAVLNQDFHRQMTAWISDFPSTATLIWRMRKKPINYDKMAKLHRRIPRGTISGSIALLPNPNDAQKAWFTRTHDQSASGSPHVSSQILLFKHTDPTAPSYGAYRIFPTQLFIRRRFADHSGIARSALPV